MKTQIKNPPDRDFAKFGGFQFSNQMELCFARMVKVLEEILNVKVKEFPHPTGLLLANIHQNALAALSLAPNECLNEAYLIMRVLVDTGVTFGCLLTSDEAERKKYFEQPVSSAYLKSATSDELLQQARSLAEIDVIPPNRLGSIRNRIEVLVQRTGINRDAWLMVVASIFPQSSEVLCGGPYAHIFRFLKSPESVGSGRSRDEFTMLHLMASAFLYEIICLCAKKVAISELKAKAEAINDVAMELMQKAQKGIDDPVKGAWIRMERIEHFGALKLASALVEFEEAFEFSYEAGVIVPTLRKENQSSNFKHAALYLRRALNDFRAVWLMLARGYTSQASTCAGSLFEACLATICLLKPDKVKEFETWQKSATGNDFPWGGMHMAKVVCADGRDLDDPSPDYQNLWRALYARYVWLSQIRHSTFQSVIHDTQSTTLDSGGYVIMALPNATEEDLPVKIRIAIGALADLHQAITAWLKALGYTDKTGDAAFDERMQKVDEEIEALLKRHSNLKNPITIQRTKFMNRHPPVSKS
jgi:hypothetical protein